MKNRANKRNEERTSSDESLSSAARTEAAHDSAVSRMSPISPISDDTSIPIAAASSMSCETSAMRTLESPASPFVTERSAEE